MKILVFTGGLGNQIFGYAFYLWLKKTFPRERVYGFYSNKKMGEHYGLEIDKYFKVSLPSSPYWIRVITGLLYLGKKTGITTHLVDMQVRTFNPNTIANTACKMHINYVLDNVDQIKFKEIVFLDDRNKDVLKQINNSESVFLHVRRGDYYSPQYIEAFGNICTVEYYTEAIKFICSKVDNPRFFVFSDDMAWVRSNLEIPKASYIDWNTGNNSFIDMYLMSHCKYAIMANSTFSYWSAMLTRKKQIVYYPQKWENEPYTAPEIFPKDWIGYINE